MNAALGIADIPGKIEWIVKGYADRIGYFDLFRNSELFQKESHVWFRVKVVTVFDDHDQVRNGEQKARFCAKNKDWQKLVVNAMAFNVLTLGIPCIYYGTEQCFEIGDSLTCLYSSDQNKNNTQIEVTEKCAMNAVWLTVPAAGCVIFK